MKVEQYQQQIASVPTSNIAYIDEPGIDAYLYREYAWSVKGKAVYDRVSGRKYQRTSIVAAQIENKIVAPLQYSGTMDSSLFELWFEQFLLPTLPESTVIVMDNAAFHRKSRLFSLAQKSGFQLVFLPAYSPELNPIEHFWSWLKRRLRKILPFCNSLDDAIFDCFKVR